jgi:hypothetical protein
MDKQMRDGLNPDHDKPCKNASNGTLCNHLEQKMRDNAQHTGKWVAYRAAL